MGQIKSPTSRHAIYSVSILTSEAGKYCLLTEATSMFSISVFASSVTSSTSFPKQAVASSDEAELESLLMKKAFNIADNIFLS